MDGHHHHMGNNTNTTGTTHAPTTMDHGGHGGHGGHGSHGGTGGHGNFGNAHMMMYFHFSKQVVILFEGWSVDSAEGIIGSCIAIFILAALYEGLKVLREVLKRRYSYVVSVDMTESKTYGTGPGQTAVITETKGQLPRSRLCNWHHFLQTFLHIVQVTVSYFLMLIFMTYNVWLCLAVALGAGCGYFAFGWKLNKVIDIYEHCH